MSIKNLAGKPLTPGSTVYIVLARCNFFGKALLTFVSISAQFYANGALIETAFAVIKAVLAIQTHIKYCSRFDPPAS